MKREDLILIAALVLLAWLIAKRCRCEHVSSTIDYNLPETT
jgi:hypothetical protein